MICAESEILIRFSIVRRFSIPRATAGLAGPEWVSNRTWSGVQTPFRAHRCSFQRSLCGAVPDTSGGSTSVFPIKRGGTRRKPIQLAARA